MISRRQLAALHCLCNKEVSQNEAAHQTHGGSHSSPRGHFSFDTPAAIGAACPGLRGCRRSGHGRRGRPRRLRSSRPHPAHRPNRPAGSSKKFAARESEFARARESYTFRQTVKVDTSPRDTGKPDGEYQQVTDITFNKDGKREEHVVFAPQNTLERVIMSPTDFEEIEHRLPFILTTEDLPKYDISYLGRQKVDDLETYVFTAGPRTIEKGKHYFEGKVWVDQQDFQIVLVNGKTVPQDTRRGHEDLQPPFTTYYEQIDGKYWFPTYTKAEGKPALRRPERRALAGRAHAQRSPLHRLQAVSRHLAHHL